MTHTTTTNPVSDRAFWAIDKTTSKLFDEFVLRDNLPTHDERGAKIRCRRWNEGNTTQLRNSEGASSYNQKIFSRNVTVENYLTSDDHLGDFFMS